MLKNKRFLSLFLTLALIIGILVGAAPQTAFADDEVKYITILHVNDVHGRVELDEREGAIGFGRLKTKVDELRAANPNTLLINAGDTSHGTTIVNISKGAAMIDLMNLVGFDVLVPGNHDFNYGYKRLLELRDMAKFPVVAANVVNEADKSLFFEPYTIKEIDGIKLGIFGLVTDETKFKSHPDNTEGVEFTDAVLASKKMVAELKEKGADVIIALAHLGIEGTTTMTSQEVAEQVEGIDLLVDGHSHEILNKQIGDTLIVQADSYTKNIGMVDLKIKDGKIIEKTASLISFDQVKDLTPNAEIEAAIEKINKENEPILEEVVGKTTVELVGERGLVRTGETNLGNLITDIMLEVSGADVALTNGGGIRASIEAGDIKVKDIVTAFPFTNTVAVIEVTGAEILEVLEFGVKSYPEESGGFLHIAGMTFKFDPEKPVGEKVRDVMVKGQAIDKAKTYKLVTNDFIAAGGDDYVLFKGKPFVGEDGLLSDILISYMRQAGEIAPATEGRIVAEKAAPELVPEVAAKKYTVKPNDVLWRIAKGFNTTWQKLAEVNKLKNPNLIFPNQILLIK